MLTYLSVLCEQLRANVQHVREHPDDGYSTETVVVTAILVALALAVIGVIIYNKVVGKANSINLGL